MRSVGTLAVVETGDFLPAQTVVMFAIFGTVLGAAWIWSLVDALRISEQCWDMAGRSKVLWVVLIAVLGVLGSLLYVAIPRRELSRPEAR